MILEAVQRWLNAHCLGREDIVGAVVVRQGAAGNEPEMVARYPVAAGAGAEGAEGAASSLHASLTNVAREALRRGSSLNMVPAVVPKGVSYARVAALPVRGESSVVGAVAIAVRSQDAAVAKRILDEIERVTMSLAASLAPGVAKSPVLSTHAGGAHLKLLNMVAVNEGLRECASKLANQIAEDAKFDRVSISLMQGGRLRLIAVSRTRDLDEQIGRAHV